MSDLELLPHMYAPLQLMFAEHCVEMELKAAHRARQKERASSPNLSAAGTRTYSTCSTSANADSAAPNADDAAANAGSVTDIAGKPVSDSARKQDTLVENGNS